jgi:hypothetical protein
MIPIEKLTSRVNKLNDEKEFIVSELANIQKANGTVTLTRLEVKQISENAGFIFENGSIPDKKNIVKSLIKKIVVDEKGDLQFYWNFK